MKSKMFTVLAACIGLILGGLFCGNAIAKQYVIKLGHIDPVSHPHNLASQKFADWVKQRTGGNVVVQVYPSGQLGNAPNLMEQLQFGTVQIFQGGIGWWGSSVPDYWLVASNFVFKDLKHSRAVLKGEIGQRLAEKLQKTKGVRVLTQGLIRNPRNLLTVRPVRTLDDLKGLKIRVPEMANWMIPWKALGANPTPMPLTETFLGLQQGLVEGVEHGYPQLYLNHYTEVARYLTNTRHQYEMAGFFMSDAFYKKLPRRYQEIVTAAAIEAELYNNQLQPKYREDSRQKMMEQGVKFIDIDTKPWNEIGWKIMKNEVVPKLKITPGLLEEINSYKY